MYFVYTLRSKKDKSFYTGITQNLERRLKEHNKIDTKTTRSKKPWSMVYYEPWPNRPDARKWEKFLKSGSGREWRQSILPR